ncbi:helix-turn-helix domain-containing protein [Streptomyces sp. NPDC045369]|uniref:PucR family transcriptional regulator n=1 Tax=Streptomyces sp. NPDC045369 TaxID=3155732 RepID=UPI0033D72FDF
MGEHPKEPLPEEQRLALRLAVDRLRGRLPPPAHALCLTRPDHALVFSVWPGGVGDEAAVGAAEGMAEALVRRLGAELPSVPPRAFRAGVGRVRHRLAEAAVSYEEARQAAEVAQATESGQAVTAYARLGVYALLAKLSSTDLVESMHPGLRDLLQPETGVPELVDALTTYLDEAGDVRRTATRLHIHRSPLCNRPHRIEKLTGLSLARGDDCLTAPSLSRSRDYAIRADHDDSQGHGLHPTMWLSVLTVRAWPAP